MNESYNTAEIRRLNDEFRQTFEGGQVLITPGIQALPAETLSKVLQTIRAFDDFNEANDPWNTHEFGSIEVDGSTAWFRIDCYDANLEYGSPNAADPQVTKRVMTILTPSEY